MPTEELFGNYNFVKGSPRQPGDRRPADGDDVDPVLGPATIQRRIAGQGDGDDAVGRPEGVVPSPSPDAPEVVEFGSVPDATAPEVVDGGSFESLADRIADDGPDDDGFFDDMMDGTQI